MKKLLVLLCATLISSTSFAENHNMEVTGPKVEMLVKSSASWDGTALPAYPTGTPEITIMKYTFPPGVQLPMHKHPVINAGVLLSGELTVVTEDNTELHLKAGDPIIELVNKWHYGKNEGKQDAVILIVYAGEKGKALVVRK